MTSSQLSRDDALALAMETYGMTREQAEQQLWEEENLHKEQHGGRTPRSSADIDAIYERAAQEFGARA